MPITKLPIIKFAKHSDDRGDLIVVDRCLPFDVKRIFYIKGVPSSGPSSQRGGHAHRTGGQVLVAIKGSFKVATTENGIDFFNYALHDDTSGLHVPPMTWMTLYGFTPGAICLVLASNHYDEADHIRDYNEFLKEITGEGFLLH